MAREAERSRGDALTQARRHRLEGPPLLAAARAPLQPALDVGEVREEQLEIDQLDVLRRVDAALDVDGVRVFEGAHHMAQGVAVARRPEELIPEALAAAGALG